MSKFRFVRKNGKVVGPLPADRIDHLFSESKLASDDELSENRDGPWQSVATLQERIERIKKKKQAEVKKRLAAQRSEASKAPTIPDVNEPAQTVDASDAIDPFANPPHFPDPLAAGRVGSGPFSSFESPALGSHAVPMPTSQRRRVRSQSRPSERSGEELDATDPLRWIFPWKWETDTQPYPMLVVYLKFSRAILRLLYLLFVVFGFVCLAIMGVSMLQGTSDATSSQGAIATLLTIPLVALLWWLVAQLFYIAGMASIDVLRCFLAIERNTRE